jgi:hypothetical protein
MVSNSVKPLHRSEARICHLNTCNTQVSLPKADGTTLGADNGIGVAAALALLDAPKDAKLPPIEALFTVVGASACCYATVSNNEAKRLCI